MVRDRHPATRPVRGPVSPLVLRFLSDVPLDLTLEVPFDVPLDVPFGFLGAFFRFDLQFDLPLPARVWQTPRAGETASAARAYCWLDEGHWRSGASRAGGIRWPRSSSIRSKARRRRPRSE